MKTKKWLGLATALSPYDAPTGTAQEQSNLQVALPGQATPRKGLERVAGESGYTAYSVYGKPTGATNGDTVIAHVRPEFAEQRQLVEVDSNGDYQILRSLSQDQDHQPTFAEDRHGATYMFYGHGQEPLVRRTVLATDGTEEVRVDTVGLEAPTARPEITLSGQGMFVERIDVIESGGAYATPPEVTLSMGGGGTFGRQATARAVLEAGRVVAIEVTDGGNDYSGTPEIKIDDTNIGSGFRGKAYVATSANVYTISNYINYDSNGNELNPPQLYTSQAGVSLDSDVNGGAAPSLGSSETYGSTQFSATNKAVTVARKVITLNVESSAAGQIVVNGDYSHLVGLHLSYASQTINTLRAASATYDDQASPPATTIGLNNATHIINPAQNVTFWSREEVSLLQQSTSQTYTASVALQSDGTGTGAAAVITFADDSVQYSVGIPANTSADTIDRFEVSGSPTYISGASTFALQGNPNRRKRGWVGRENYNEDLFGNDTGTYRSVYWQDWSRIGYFVNTGSLASPTWVQRSKVLSYARYVTNSGKTLFYAYADIPLEPTTDTNVPSNAVHPTVRVKFAFCTAGGTAPWYREWEAAWRVFNDNQCGPSYYRGSNPRWWRTAVPQPIVDLWQDDPLSDDYYDHTGYNSSSTVTRISDGSFIPSNTKYELRFSQVAAHAEQNLASSNGPTYHDFGANNAPVLSGKEIELQFTANEVVSQAGTAPPGDVTQDPSISTQGTGWSAGDSAYVQLLKRPTNSTSLDDVSFGTKYTWNAVLEEASSSTDYIASVAVTAQGSGYLSPPTILTTTTSGYGLRVEPTVVDGAITSLNLLDGGAGFTADNQPTLFTEDSGATAVAVMRSTMRGTYRCAYRFADTSATIVGTASVSCTAGSDQATVVYDEPSDLVGKVLDMTGLPHKTTVASVVPSGTTATITLSKPATQTLASQNAIIRDYTKPIAYSDFSPIVDVDCGPNATRLRTSILSWAIDATAPERADTVELYRTSGDQSLVFYRLEAYGTVTAGSVAIVGDDTLTDEELYDSTRPNYAAVPIVLPNGGLNAYRFGVPRSDMGSACAYQDRLWYAGTTSGDAINTIFFSEYDEFESCPKENSLSIQNNQRSNDAITTLIPFGSVLLVMQRLHCYQLTYNTDPNVDSALQFIANRGCISPQCYDVFDSTLYCLDERGVYAMTRAGEVKELSEPIADMFVKKKIDFTKKASFFLKVDPQQRVLRAFVCDDYTSDNSPNLAVCLHLTYGTWWTETYANGLLAATDAALDSTGALTPIYASQDGNLYQFAGKTDKPYRCLTGGVTVTTTADFAEPPELIAYTEYDDSATTTARQGGGARFLPVMRGSKISEVIVLDRGSNYGRAFSDPNTNPFDSSITVATLDGTVVGTAQALAPDSTNLVAIPWRYRTSNQELISGENAKGGDGLIDRSVILTYEPTETQAVLELRQFFNNSKSPRENVMPRNRGTGFVQELEGGKSTLDMSVERSSLGNATGVSKAVFAGRTSGDLTGADKHISVGLYYAPVETTDASTLSSAELYGLELRGVINAQ